MNLSALSIESFKEFCELTYWKMAQKKDKLLKANHYQEFYTTYFDIPLEYYKDKVVMDIGCGPRGSLEWANETKERIGLDPLADKYLKMGAERHQMKYVKGYVENLPFSDNYFDIICSFNSLDHVKDINKSCEEIKRTLKPGGRFLLVVDIHKYPTFTEPQCLRWSFVEDYFPEFEIIEKKRLRDVINRRIYSNLRANSPMDVNDHGKGVLVAFLKKPSA